MAKVIFENVTNEDAIVLVDGKPFALSYTKNLMLDSSDEPMYDDAEDFVMHTMCGLHEDLVEEVVPLVADEILPHIKQYLP